MFVINYHRFYYLNKPYYIFDSNANYHRAQKSTNNIDKPISTHDTKLPVGKAENGMSSAPKVTTDGTKISQDTAKILDKNTLDVKVGLSDLHVDQFGVVKNYTLPNDIIRTFTGGCYTSRILDKEIMLYRVGSSKFEYGQYFSRDKASSMIQARIDKALPHVWSNGEKVVVDTLYTFKVPEGTLVSAGEISSQGGFFVGGTQQIVIEKGLWKHIKLIKKEPLK